MPGFVRSSHIYQSGTALTFPGFMPCLHSSLSLRSMVQCGRMSMCMTTITLCVQSLTVFSLKWSRHKHTYNYYIYTSIKNNWIKLEDEVGMAGPKSTQTRFVGIITSTIHHYTQVTSANLLFTTRVTCPMWMKPRPSLTPSRSLAEKLERRPSHLRPSSDE